ncbi:sulfotransferase family 2 domain-containing protein [Solimonas terrae]|uniref:Sulfotransferase family protein n=1 Tax=Solimonas terrae TaxID=1396819 RepID=A0A6M2BPZ5_9GAMM|nr:sulfotransferase family 2 domain-containing protein [Solimonas terrae]NGY04528.1 sulfotransferase family protein [Solimonas terrae]
MKAHSFIRSALFDAVRLYDPYPYRRYMRANRIVFIHVPKTGGTAFLDAMKAKRARMHIPWQVFWQANKYRFERYRKLAVVRNPYDRVVSIYSYLMGGGSPGTDGPLAADVARRAPNFESFVLEYLQPSRICLHNLFRPQAFYVCDHAGKIMVDHLCRFENLQADLDQVLRAVGMKNVVLAPVNRSVRSLDWRTYYTEASAERVRELYSCDFDAFEYERSFEIPDSRESFSIAS